MAKVLSIHRVEKKAAPAIALNEATFLADFGMEGDWRSRKGRGRQITLIEEEALRFVAGALHLDTIPLGASRRQVMVSGIELNATVGKRMKIGPLLIEIHDRCDPCKNMETMIAPGAWWAMKERGGVCGRVIEGGVLRVGDEVTVLP